MGDGPLAHFCQYFRPEISLFAFHRSDMEETEQCGIHDTGIADSDDWFK